MARRRGNGEGSIYQRKADGLWCGSVSLGTATDGKPIRRTVYGRTRKEVAEKLATLQHGLNAGIPEARKDLTVKDLLEEFLATKRQAWAPQTYTSAEQQARLHILPTLGAVKLSSLDTRTVTRWLISKPQTRYMVLARDLLHAACEMGLRYEWLARNPVATTERVKYTKKAPKEISQEQVARVLEATKDNRYYAAVCLGIGCGLRPSEVVGLTWDRWDEEQGLILVDRQLYMAPNLPPALVQLKTRGSVRVVQVPTFAALALTAHRREQEAHRARIEAQGRQWGNEWGLMFVGLHGQPTSSRVYGNSIARSLRNAQVPHTTPHTLRHAFASALVDANLPITEITAAMGHATAAVTMQIYAHIITDKPRRTGSVLDRFVGGEKQG